MAGTNAVIPFLGGTLGELADTIGITRFPIANYWYQTIGGILVQGSFIGGLIGGTTASVVFQAAFPTQLLGIFIQVAGGTQNNAYVTAQTLEGFDLVNGASIRDYYWWAIGV